MSCLFKASTESGIYYSTILDGVFFLVDNVDVVVNVNINVNVDNDD